MLPSGLKKQKKKLTWTNLLTDRYDTFNIDDWTTLIT